VTLVAKKRAEIFWGPFLSKGRLNLWAKYSEPKKQIAKKEFLLELQEFEVRTCVQPNSPIIIRILLSFHKFAMSMGAKHLCYTNDNVDISLIFHII